MDRLESLGNQLSQITMYDIKTMYNQAKNMVLNVTEMEAKVREATNDDPWGASSTLMQEIAQGTFNFQHFNEIMPCIYSRFMDKEARQWREIYKSLQLLEYIVKHGSERVVDDARSHLSTIKMLRNFHYIDEKGKDQGVNVRNRSRELSELLMDVEKIRTERRKAKANRNKYTGVGSDTMSSSFSGSRYGGFGSDSPGGGSYDRDYGGNSSASGFRDETPGRRGYEEYDAGDYETTPRRSNSLTTTGSARSGSGATPGRTPTKPTPAPAKEAPKPAKVVDLLGFDDGDDFSGGTAANKALPAVAPLNALDGDDDFDDFQTAPPSAPANPPNVFAALNAAAAPQTSPPLASQPTFTPQVPVQQQRTPFNASAFPAMSPSANRQSFMGAMQSPPMYTGQQVMNPTLAATRPTHAPQGSFGASTVGSSTATGAKATPSTGNFDDLWSMSLGTGAASNKQSMATGAKSIKDLEKEKAQAGIWGQGGGGQMQNKQSIVVPGMGSMTGSFGTTSGGGASAGTGAGAEDDLLL